MRKRVFFQFSVWKSSGNWSKVEKEKLKKKLDSDVLDLLVLKKKLQAFWKMVIQPYQLLDTEHASMMVPKIGSSSLPCWYMFRFYVSACGVPPKRFFVMVLIFARKERIKTIS